MNRNKINFLLGSILVAAMPALVFAQEAVPHAPSFGELLSKMMPMLVMVFFIFYFMVLKPQQKKIKAHEDMIKELKKGERVITAGGILGKVVEISEDGISLEIAPGVKVKCISSKVTKKISEEAVKKAA